MALNGNAHHKRRIILSPKECTPTSSGHIPHLHTSDDGRLLFLKTEASPSTEYRVVKPAHVSCRNYSRYHADVLLLLQQLQALACSTVPLETASQEPTVEIQGLVTQDHWGHHRISKEITIYNNRKTDLRLLFLLLSTTDPGVIKQGAAIIHQL